MARFMLSVTASLCIIFSTQAIFARELNVTLYPALAEYVEKRTAEFYQIPTTRRAELQQFARLITKGSAAGDTVRLTFICTHNSRRSHMAQLWAAAATAQYGVDGVEIYSGGTEATAFNTRAIAALRRAGFEIEETIGDGSASPLQSDNPYYAVAYATDRAPLVCFSKKYETSPNPRANFIAVMTCSDADEECPMVRGAVHRISIPYDDPKASDGAPQEEATYDKRCAQIAREMLFAFSLVK